MDPLQSPRITRRHSSTGSYSIPRSHFIRQDLDRSRRRRGWKKLAVCESTGNVLDMF